MATPDRAILLPAGLRSLNEPAGFSPSEIATDLSLDRVEATSTTTKVVEAYKTTEALGGAAVLAGSAGLAGATQGIPTTSPLTYVTVQRPTYVSVPSPATALQQGVATAGMVTQARSVSPARSLSPSPVATQGSPGSVKAIGLGGISSVGLGRAGTDILSVSRTEFVEGEFEKQILQVSESKQAELNQLQWNLLKEQISNLSRELTAIRQDINTLRLADSQYEVQNAETARHVREMQAQFRMDLQAQTSQVQDITSRLEVSVASLVTDVQSTSRSLSELKASATKDLVSIDDRLTKVAGAFDEQATSIQQVRVTLDEQKKGLERVRFSCNDLAVETQSLRSMRSDFDAQISETQISLRQVLEDVRGGLGADIQLLKENHATLSVNIEAVTVNTTNSQTSSVAIMKDQIMQLTNDFSSRRAIIEELVSKVASQEKTAREQLAIGWRAQLQDCLANQGKLRDQISDQMSRTEKMQFLINEQITEVRGSNEKASSGVGDQLKDLEKRMMDKIAGLSKEHTSKHMEIREHITKTVAQEKATREETHQSHKADLQDQIGKLRANLNEHKSSTDDFQVTLKAMVEKERGLRERAHGGLGDRFEEIELRIKDHASEFGTLREKVSSSVATATKHDQLHKDFSRFADDHEKRHDQLKSGLTDALSTVDSLQQKFTMETKSITDAHNRAIDGLHTKHADITDQLTKFNNDHHGKHAEIHQYFSEKILGHDQRLRDASTRVGSDRGDNVSWLELERKLREEIGNVSNEHHGRHAAAKEQMAKMSNDHHKELTDLKDQVARTHSHHKGVLDEHRDGMMSALQDVESRLRREVGASGDQSQSKLQEHLAKERQGREATHLILHGRVDELDRRMKDAMSAMASTHDSNHSTLQGMLGALERKLRDEVAGSHDEHSNKLTDLKEQLNRHANEHGSRHAELKDLVARVQLDEKRAREEGAQGVAGVLEQVEAKLRKEMAAGSEKGHGNLKDHVAQERQTREKAMAVLIDRLSDLEKKLVTELSQISLRDAGSADLRDLIVTACSKERENMQAMLTKEQEFRASQLENIGKTLVQEKATRETQLESLRVYLVGDKAARESKEKNMLMREELDAEIKRIWAEIRHHTHDVKALQVPQPQPQPKPQPPRPRSPSPVPGSRLTFSPSQRVVRQMSVPQTAVVAREAVMAPPTTVVPVQAVPTTTTQVVQPTTTVVREQVVQPAAPVVREQVVIQPRSPAAVTREQVVQSAPMLQTAQIMQGAPMACAGVDTNNDGRPNYLVIGADLNNDGIPDVLQNGGAAATQLGVRSESPKARVFR